MEFLVRPSAIDMIIRPWPHVSHSHPDGQTGRADPNACGQAMKLNSMKRRLDKANDLLIHSIKVVFVWAQHSWTLGGGV